MTCNISDVDRYRAGLAPSRGVQGVQSLNQHPFPIIDLVGYKVCIAEQNALRTNPKPACEVFTHEEELAYGATIWLWDYLRRSTAKGFFLPLSGGIDSASSLALVGVMC
jgi:NAD+ synthase (glutamine-hydrolysing)